MHDIGADLRSFGPQSIADEVAARRELLRERDERWEALTDALSDPLREAFIGNISSRAREHIATDDFSAMLNDLVERLDNADLHIISRPR